MPLTEKNICTLDARCGRFPARGMWEKLAYAAAGIISATIIWQLLGLAIISRPGYGQFHDFLPVPTGKALLVMIDKKDFWLSVAASLRRVLVGIILAFTIGLPAGILIGFYRKLQLMASTPIQFIRMISPLSWMPIAMLLFKEFESAIYFLITMATVWPVVLNTTLGVSRVDERWLNMAKNQGATNIQLIFRVILPASTPYILTSLRLALGVAWIVLVPVEFLGVSNGLGYLINDARDILEYDRLMAIVLAIGLLGFILDGIIQIFQKFFNWSWAN